MATKSYKKYFNGLVFLKNKYSCLAVLMLNQNDVLASKAEAVTTSAKAPAVSGENIMGMVFSLILILAIILILAWAAKRFGGMAFKGNAALKVLAGMSMGARERIVLVQVGEKQILLGVAPGRIQTLHVLDEPIVTDAGSEPVASIFADRLKSVLNKSK